MLLEREEEIFTDEINWCLELASELPKIRKVGRVINEAEIAKS